MAKSNISDIDYDVFNVTSVDEKPAEPQKQKSAGISQRSISKAKASEKADANMRDLTGASDPTEIANRATETSNALPNPEVPDALANYALPGLGALGTGLAAYGLWKNKDKMTWDKSVGGAPPEGMTQKTDLRDIQPAAAPAAQELPKPQFPQGNVQQPAVSGYGQQTINAPTGAPNVAAPAAPVAPPAEVAPQPVDPLQEARIRKANAEAAIAEHRLQQLQSGATQKSSGKAPAAASESEMQMIQKGGAASVSQRQAAELKAMESNIVPTPDPIQTTATPVEKQAAVATVAKEEKKQIAGKAGDAVEPKMSPAAKAGIEKFNAQYPKIAEDLAKEGKVGLLGFGSGDIHLYNTYGAEGRKAVLERFNQGNPLGPYEPNYEAMMGKVRKGVPSSEVADLMAKLPAESEAGNFGKANFGKAAAITPEGKLVHGANTVNKIVKAGGPALMLMAIADAAKAAQEGNYAPAKETGFDLASGAGLAALLGGPAAAVGALGLGSSGLNKDEEKQLAYLRKVGAGRGIAPPSSYKR